MKYQSEEMLSSSLTKVMTMPKPHVKKCGLKDLQLATIAMVMQVMVKEATAMTVVAHGARDDQPERFVLKATMGVFLVGVFAGMFLMKKLDDDGTKGDCEVYGHPGVRKYIEAVLTAPAYGRNFHLIRASATPTY